MFALSITTSHCDSPPQPHPLIQKITAFFHQAFFSFIFLFLSFTFFKSIQLHFSKVLRPGLGRWQWFPEFNVCIRVQYSLHRIHTEDPHWDLAKLAQQFPKDNDCLQSCLLCSRPGLSEFPAYRRFPLLAVKHMTLSVVLLKFILFLLLLPRSSKAPSALSWSFPVLAMPSSVESSGYSLSSYLNQGLRLILAKAYPMGDHGGCDK